MSQRRAEIAGAGFAGLAAACALAGRGWRVTVHERGERIRSAGAGIYIYENGLRVLETLGAYDAAVATAPKSVSSSLRPEWAAGLIGPASATMPAVASRMPSQFGRLGGRRSTTACRIGTSGT